MKPNSLLGPWLLVCGSVALVAFAPEQASAEPIFSDGFESADFLHSENGFKWGGTNRTSIVRDDGYVVNNGKEVLVGPLPERQWENAPESSGRHAMRFYYPAGEAHSEQRFSLGGVYDEIWIRYWLRVPINFDMTVSAGTGNNNKFFALWQDAYATKGTGGNIQWNFWRQDNGGARFTFSMSNADGSGHHGEYRDFMTIADRGRWMQIVLYAKRASTATSNDGEARIWRRWEGETEFTLISESTDKNLRPPDAGPAGWQAGYILGWANSAYTENTEYLLDDFTVSATSLLYESAAPKPPEAVGVK